MEWIFGAILALGILAALTRFNFRSAAGIGKGIQSILTITISLALVCVTVIYLYKYINSPASEVKVHFSRSDEMIAVMGVNTLARVTLTLNNSPRLPAKYLCIFVIGAEQFKEPPRIIDAVVTGHPLYFVKEFDPATKAAMNTLGITEVKVKFVMKLRPDCM